VINALIYCLAVWLANYTATMFIPFPVFGMVSVGTLIFGVTFTQRDRVHRYGRRPVYLMIAVAAVGMVIESALLGVPWRIILASFTAIILSETADTEVYHHLLRRPWLQRVVRSNAVSIPLDSAIFNLIAFLGVFPPLMLIQIIFGEIVTKTLTGALVALIKSRDPVADSTTSLPQAQ
jgi:uncharacterized PurR-regulated membrane protein YhhQ (DUF165 family)